MNAHLVFGFFALYVAIISLWLVLSGQQDAILAFLRRCWGRTLGYGLFFLVHFALPMLVCVFCLGWGVRQYDPEGAMDTIASPLQLNLDAYRDVLLRMEKEPPAAETFGVIYGA